MTADHLRRLLLEHVRAGGVDLYITSGQRPRATSPAGLAATGPVVPAPVLEQLLTSTATAAQQRHFDHAGSVALTTRVGGVRLRAQFFVTAHGLAANFHRLPDAVPDVDELDLPPPLLALAEHTQGLVLVTGPQRSGKATTLAGLVTVIGRARRQHIVTVEDPIEFVLPADSGPCSQLEVGRDVPSYEQGIEQALDLCPAVLVAGNLPLRAIVPVLAAAEAGALVLASIAANDVNALVGELAHTLCPSDAQAAIPTLVRLLKGIVFQRLLPDGRGRGWHSAREVYGPGSSDPQQSHGDGPPPPLPSLQRQTPTMQGLLLDLVRRGRVAVEDAVRMAPDRLALTYEVEALEHQDDILHQRRH